MSKYTHTEKKLLAVSTHPFTADGTSVGVISVDNACDFKVKQAVLINSDTQPSLILEVKRVVSESTMLVGPLKAPIQVWSDMSAYTLADNARIEAKEQFRPNVPEQEVERITYEEEPVMARRVVAVDSCGRKYTLDNPFPVQLSDGSIQIGTVNAELEVQLSHQDDVPDAGDVADSVQVGDGNEILLINPDGSINVKLSLGSPGTFLNIFSEISSVAKDTPTTVGTYTVPIGKTAFLIRVGYGGTNIATYEVKVNAAIEGRRRTWFNGLMSDNFLFDSPNGSGLPLIAGDIVTLTVEHPRPFVGDFEGRIQVIEV